MPEFLSQKSTNSGKKEHFFVGGVSSCLRNGHATENGTSALQVKILFVGNI